MMPQIFAVIHVKSLEQTHHNIRIAEDTGCDGAFLISHDHTDSSVDNLWSLYFSMRRMSRLLLGVNQLFLNTGDAMIEAYHKGIQEGLRVHMLWSDNYKNTHHDHSLPELVRDYQLRTHKDSLLYFGGVAFKYQPEENLRGDFLAREVASALPFVDVLTTSGVSTGEAPDLEKIRTMREAMGPNGKLAVASGITPDNVQSFLPYVDSFLVSTGISKDFHTLDPVKTHSLVRRIKQ